MRWPLARPLPTQAVRCKVCGRVHRGRSVGAATMQYWATCGVEHQRRHGRLTPILHEVDGRPLLVDRVTWAWSWLMVALGVAVIGAAVAEAFLVGGPW